MVVYAGWTAHAGPSWASLGGLAAAVCCCREGYSQRMTDSGTTRKPRPSRPVLRPQDQVVFNGRKATITEAEAAVGYPVPLPDTSVANQANLDEVWVNDGRRHVWLVFAGKITVSLHPAVHADQARHFERFVVENDATAEVGQVHGQPALIISPNTDACESNPAWVEFYRDGISINVVSHHYGTEILLAAAESMP
jgi:hypothetical protein